MLNTWIQSQQILDSVATNFELKFKNSSGLEFDLNSKGI
jgi:hypothetical protein